MSPYPHPLASTGLRTSDGPLAAHPDPGRALRMQQRRHPAPKHRLRRFVHDYGWRAYAIPLLTVATFLTLLQVAEADPSGSPSSPAGATNLLETAPAPTTPAQTTPAEETAEATGEGEPVDPTATFAPGTFVQRGSGNLSLVPGTSAVLGSGPLLRFQVEVEDGIDSDGQAFAVAVEATLADPRGWGSEGRRSFQRVDSGPFDFKVALVSPDNVNSFCPGLDTGGYTSCRSGDRAVINLARWQTAVPDYQGDIPTYRQYVVNHEVGHALSNSHELCPGPGALAPVMQQQTLGLNGCVKNPWPYPDA